MTQVLCIGSVLWDTIGRSASHMRSGSDVAGRITHLPGGVALNIAKTLKRFGLDPVLLSSIGRDAEGNALVIACEKLGLNCQHLYRSEDLPTDQYVAIEGANGLIAAIADAHLLETTGDEILTPLFAGPFGTFARPFSGTVSLDGNLTLGLLEEIAVSPLFAKCDLRVAPASPGKAERLMPFLDHRRALLYVNLEEAMMLCKTHYATTYEAANALLAKGASRVLVTDGANPACDGNALEMIVQSPPDVLATRVTGAGDTFMATHMAAELAGNSRGAALRRALYAAARYVSGDTAL
ncbi:MAG: PfkB family carbohydrate kinase [Paracoccaceae bacterium]|nr:PfkB family carbohydrate kinase [Paracoccaceae bacterium]